jgi:hypothetical protein
VSEFDLEALDPDLEMARDPVFEEDVKSDGLDEKWRMSEKTWRDALACYDAVIYRKPLTIRPEHIATGMPAGSPRHD